MPNRHTLHALPRIPGRANLLPIMVHIRPICCRTVCLNPQRRARQRGEADPRQGPLGTLKQAAAFANSRGGDDGPGGNTPDCVSTIMKRRRRNESMLRYAAGMAVIAGLLCSPASAQTPAQGKDADKDKEAARAAQGYTSVRVWERPDVRATRVELKPMANRAIHPHDD